jgi:hypothetical protein
MTGQAIHYFLRRQNSGISKKFKWLLKKPLMQSHHQAEHSTVVHTQLIQGKVGAGLSKMKDKIGRTNTQWNLSNLELIDEIRRHSCLLFSAQPGKECANPVMVATDEDGFTPADPTEAPPFHAQKLSLRTKFQNPQSRPIEGSPIARRTTIMFSAAKSQSAASLSNESSRNGNLSVADQNTGHQGSQESIDDSSYTSDAGRPSGEYALMDTAHEQLFSETPMSLKPPQPPRIILPLTLDTPRSGDQQMLGLEFQRTLMREHDNYDHQSPNAIPQSEYRGGAVTSSGSRSCSGN